MCYWPIILIHKIYKTLEPFIIVHSLWIKIKSMQICRIRLQSYHKGTCKNVMTLSKFDELTLPPTWAWWCKRQLQHYTIILILEFQSHSNNQRLVLHKDLLSRKHRNPPSIYIAKQFVILCLHQLCKLALLEMPLGWKRKISVCGLQENFKFYQISRVNHIKFNH